MSVHNYNPLVAKVIGVAFFLSVGHCLADDDFIRKIYTSPNKRYVGVMDYATEQLKGPAAVSVFSFDTTNHRFKFLNRFEIPTAWYPKGLMITNDGQYVISGGDYGSDAKWPAASITNVQSGNQKLFYREQLLSDQEMKTHAEYPFHRWVDRVHHDRTTDTWYMTSYGSNGEAALLFKVIVSPPSISRVLPSFWKRELDRRELEFKKTRLETLSAKTVLGGLIEDTMLEMLDSPVPFYWYKERQHLVWFVPGSDGVHARAVYFQMALGGMSIEKKLSFLLPNPVLPSDDAAWISPDGKYMITVDEFDKTGSTRNTIVLSDLQKGKYKAFALSDFCSPDDLKEIHEHEGHLMWRFGMPYIEFEGEDQYPPTDMQYSEIVPAIVVDLKAKKVRLREPFQMNHDIADRR